jgi:hypothetical protein
MRRLKEEAKSARDAAEVEKEGVKYPAQASDRRVGP